MRSNFTPKHDNSIPVFQHDHSGWATTASLSLSPSCTGPSGDSWQHDLTVSKIRSSGITLKRKQVQCWLPTVLFTCNKTAMLENKRRTGTGTKQTGKACSRHRTQRSYLRPWLLIVVKFSSRYRASLLFLYRWIEQTIIRYSHKALDSILPGL